MNYHEIIQLSPAKLMLKISQNAISIVILLKGGHHPEKLVSILYIQKKRASRFFPKKSSSE
jgi:hypothetical protein